MDQQTLFIGGGVIVGVVGVLSAFLIVRQKSKNNAAATGSTGKLARSLHDEKQKSDIILASIEDGVILIDEQRTIQLFNPGATAITGWTAEEAVGLDFHSVLKFVNDKDEPYTEAENPFTRVFNENTTIRDNKATIISRSDKHISLSLSVSPLLNENQQAWGAVGVFRDVSEERQQEQQSAEFISTASHEMRTPVAAIEGYLSLALNDKVSTIDTRARGYLEKAHASTQHLGELFQDLLTSAKAEDGRLASHPALIEVGTFIEHLAQDLRFSAEKKSLPVELVIGAPTSTKTGQGSTLKTVRPLYYVFADPDRLREVVTNLFDNAVKYTEQGKISLGLTGNESVVQMYVKDTGPGIPREDIGHLFQKFYRVDSSATRTIGGTGLGLFICRKIIELYDGKIWVESEVNKGSTFYINLPRLSNQRVQELQKAAAQGITPTTS